MNIFETVKAHITTRQAAEQYGLTVTRSGMICCPFHHEGGQAVLLFRLSGDR